VIAALVVAAQVAATGIASFGTLRGPFLAALRVALSIALTFTRCPRAAVFARALPLAARFLPLPCDTAIAAVAPVTATAALLRKRGAAAQQQQCNERRASAADTGVWALPGVSRLHDAKSFR